MGNVSFLESGGRILSRRAALDEEDEGVRERREEGTNGADHA